MLWLKGRVVYGDRTYDDGKPDWKNLGIWRRWMSVSEGVIEASEPYSELDEGLRGLLRPMRAHDDLSFDELAERYNFQLTGDRRALLTRLVIRECLRLSEEKNDRVSVLNVGCGEGVGQVVGFCWIMRKWIGDFWGIEPDTEVESPSGLYDNFQHASMETAKLPEDHFDVVFSFLVMEHVADPSSYFEAVARCLKPGGVHLFVTPNRKHYFARITMTLKMLRLEEFVLRMLHGNTTPDYHYPVQYKCNTKKSISSVSKAAGFEIDEIAYVEKDGPKKYLPGPLVILFYLLVLKRKVWKRSDVLLTIISRSVKGA